MALPLLFLASLAAALPAQATYQITRGVLGCGAGAPATDGTHQIRGTLAQTAIGPSSETIYELHGGFWWTDAYFSSDVAGSETGEPVPYRLDQNQPNPFNPITLIRFSLSAPGPVELVLFDIRGRKVRTLLDSEIEGGPHDFTLDAEGLAGGIYFYRLTAGRFQQVRKLTLLN